MSEMNTYLDKRLDRLEDKIDLLKKDVKFISDKYWLLVGMATVFSSIVSLIITIFIKMK